MPKLKWRNVLTNQCPKCGCYLGVNSSNTIKITCRNMICKIKISRRQFDQMKTKYAAEQSKPNGQELLGRLGGSNSKEESEQQN